MDICESIHYGVITGVTFGRSDDSQYEDIVCVSYTYWDSEKKALYESSISYEHIYTSGKNSFQKFCREFGAIDDEGFDLENILGIMCMAEYHLDSGKLMRLPNQPECHVYNKVNHNFKNVSVSNSIKNIPDMISNYWVSAELDLTECYDKYYYGVITNIEEKPSKDYIEESDHIVTVMVIIDGKSVSYKFYTNGESNNKYKCLYDLCGGDVNKESLKELENTIVEVMLYRARNSGKIYISEIVGTDFPTTETESQVELLANYWLNKA